MKSCKWTQDKTCYDDVDTNLWTTECYNYFCLVEGTPEDNKMEYCCYCGSRIKQEIIGE